VPTTRTKLLQLRAKVPCASTPPVQPPPGAAARMKPALPQSGSFAAGPKLGRAHQPWRLPPVLTRCAMAARSSTRISSAPPAALSAAAGHSARDKTHS
jgi:hypothetical protein